MDWRAVELAPTLELLQLPENAVVEESEEAFVAVAVVLFALLPPVAAVGVGELVIIDEK